MITDSADSNSPDRIRRSPSSIRRRSFLQMLVALPLSAIRPETAYAGPSARVLTNHHGFTSRVDIDYSSYHASKAASHTAKGFRAYRQFVQPSDPHIRKLAEDFVSFYKDPERTAQGILYALQQCIRYVPERGTDYAKYPIETLYELKGDCEDFSILGVSLMSAAGINAKLLYVIQQPVHMAIVVNGRFSGVSYKYRAEDYYYVEPIGRGRLYNIGELSPLFARKPRAIMLG